MNEHRPTTEAPPATPRERAVRVDAIVELKAASKSRLTGAGGGRPVAVELAAAADMATAARWRASVRRVDRITIDVHDGVATCRASGIRSRLPFSVRIPLTLGLGLGRLGTPVLLTGVVG